MSALPEVRPRSLDELATVIKDALADWDRAGMEYKRVAGEAMNEAQDMHFAANPKGFWAWVERNFDLQRTQAQRYMDLANEINKIPFRAREESQPYESVADFERSRGREPSGKRSPHRDYHEPVEKILNKVDVEALREEAERRSDELKQVRKLAEQIVDIGYKALASKLHPDKVGGSRHAMTLLNAARERLRRSV